MAAHGHALLGLAAVGGGAYLLWRMGFLQGPTPAATPAPVPVVPPPIVTPATPPLAIGNPFDDLVWNHPEAALYEEYAAILNRIPDAPGQAYWLARIAQGKAAGEDPYTLGAEINAAFVNSPEAAALRAAGH